MMLQVGPIDCGHVAVAGSSFAAVCATQMGILHYKDRKWTRSRAGSTAIRSTRRQGREPTAL